MEDHASQSQSGNVRTLVPGALSGWLSFGSEEEQCKVARTSRFVHLGAPGIALVASILLGAWIGRNE